MEIETGEWLAFLAVVEAGTFRGAAEALHKAQPAVSRSVKNLEGKLRLTLFDRGAYRPVLTSAGEILLKNAQKIRQAHQELFTSASRFLKSTQVSLCVWLDYLTPLDWFLPVLRDHQNEYGDFEIKLEFGMLLDSRKPLENCDFAVTPFFEESEEAIVIELAQLCSIPVVHRKHLALINEKGLSALPQVVLRSHTNRIKDFRIQPGVKRLDVWDQHAKTRLVVEGFGWSHIDSYTLAKFPHLVKIEHFGLEPFVLKLNLVRLASKPLTHLAQTFWRRLSEQAEKL